MRARRSLSMTLTAKGKNHRRLRPPESIVIPTKILPRRKQSDLKRGVVSKGSYASSLHEQGYQFGGVFISLQSVHRVDHFVDALFGQHRTGHLAKLSAQHIPANHIVRRAGRIGLERLVNFAVG